MDSARNTQRVEDLFSDHRVGRDLSRRPAFVSVDVDSLWVIADSLGQKAGLEETVIYERAVTRFLDVFESYGVQATFFCVGRDLEVPANRKVFSEIVRRGHEIGNHSYNHPTNWIELSREVKREEILRAHRALIDAGAPEVTGYRGSGYYVDDDILKLLDESGYSYDSSVFPGAYSAVVLPLVLNLKERTFRKRSMGRLRDLVARNAPHRIKETRRLCEIPITAALPVRMPFHSSIVFATSTTYFRRCIAACTRRPLTYVFHAVDLLPDITDGRLAKHFATQKSLAEREQTVGVILNEICDRFRVTSPRELLAELTA